MKKLYLIVFFGVLSAMLMAQGGITGTGQVTVTNLPPFIFYGVPVQFTLSVDLSGVSGNEAVGLGGFVVPVGFDASKLYFVKAMNADLPGDPSANPPTNTFVHTSIDIANPSGFFAVVGATSVDSIQSNYNVANAVVWPLDLSQAQLDLTAPTGAPAQVALSLSSKWTASNGGPAVIPANATDSSFTTTGKVVLDSGDYDGDGTSDWVVFRPSNNFWYVLTTAGGFKEQGWGDFGDMPVSGDYDGDGKTDYAVYRPSAGYWFVWTQTDGYMFVGWGEPGDVPVVGDYDGDNKTDHAVYRPSTGEWFVWTQSFNYKYVPWGQPGDIPVQGDYDGDNACDYAIYRPSTSDWYVFTQTGNILYFNWGQTGDVPVPHDYDGDGTTDYAVYRPSTGEWFVWTQAATYKYIGWGLPGDVPMPGNYDGLPGADFGVYRPSTSEWFVWTQTANYLYMGWGSPKDISLGR